ncbi:Geranylgeranyl pyrophosphate synthase [Candidatus Hepatincolaceae symbiont of Richtersius coronifer]
MDFKNIIKEIQGLLELELKQMNLQIVEKMTNEVDLIPQIGNHIVFSGGKQIRPILTLLSANMFTYEGYKHIILAACIEFIHTATLLHDDVVDETKYRRGNPTANTIWGNKASVLVGDFLFSKAFELMVQTESLPILEILSNTSSTIAQGEVMQLENISNIHLDELIYLKIISAKTASLFATSTKVGAMIAKTSCDNIHNMQQYGENLGLSFQITDDALDYDSTLQTLGKEIGNDFKEGKFTLPIILLLRKCNKSEKEFILRIFQNKEYDKSTFPECLQYINKYNCIEETLEISASYVKKALEHLDKIPINNIYKDKLVALAASSAQRKY